MDGHVSTNIWPNCVQDYLFIYLYRQTWHGEGGTDNLLLSNITRTGWWVEIREHIKGKTETLEDNMLSVKHVLSVLNYIRTYMNIAMCPLPPGRERTYYLHE